MTNLEATQFRERALTLLLIERDQVNERLAELDFDGLQIPDVKRRKRGKQPSVFVLWGDFRGRGTSPL